jgi:hypothetical protein
MINENNRNNQLRIDENNRYNQFRIDENNRNNQVNFDELFLCSLVCRRQTKFSQSLLVTSCQYANNGKSLHCRQKMAWQEVAERGRSRWSGRKLAPPTRAIPPRRCHDIVELIMKSVISYGSDTRSY